MKRLSAIAVLSGLLACGCQNGCANWNSAFERMVDQPSDKPYSASEFFADGRAMRSPPDGTITREETTGLPALTEGMLADDLDRDVPLARTPAVLARGRNRFDVFCAPCHGVAGDGDSPVAAKMQLRKPPSLHEQRIIAMSPGQIYRVILKGYGLMPSYDMQLDVIDRWAVVAYVRALQLSQNVALASLPEPLRNEALESLRKQGR